LKLGAGLALAATLAGCILVAGVFQALTLHFELSEPLLAGTPREVHAGFYPQGVSMKNFLVRASGQLSPAGGAALPGSVKVTVVNEDADSGRLTYRYSLTVKVKADGTFDASKKYKRDIAANTLQTVTLQAIGGDVPAGSELTLCVDVAKKKGEFGPGCATAPSGDEEDEPPSASDDVVVVRVLDNRFEPKSITIEPGDTVRWVLEGGDLSHTSTEMNGTWDSGFVFDAEGNFYERTFPASENGRTFMYSCRSHQGCCEMQGSVRVGASAEAPDDGYGG
jgi:plastocyanin